MDRTMNNRRFACGAVLLLCASLLSVPAQALGVGQMAPDFAGPSLRDAGEVRSADYRGKVLYVDFWASWCGPCAQAFPLLQQLRSELNTPDFEVIGVNVDSDIADARTFMQKHVVSFPLVRPVGDEVPTAFGLEGMPYGLVIDRKGVVRSLHIGLRASKMPELKKQIQELLVQAP